MFTIKELGNQKINKIDKSKIPHKPGVYIHKDFSGNVLYVGKAIDLYHRVASYFSKSAGAPIFASQIAKVETIVVESELEALILEANLIKKYLPPFNIRLTDDKDYLYIAITKEDYPKVITARKKDLSTVKKSWGPFPSGRIVKDTLRSLRRVFPWCSNSMRTVYSLQSTAKSSSQKSVAGRRSCFYYHLKLCPGPCAGVISQKDYLLIINRFSKFMDGKVIQLLGDLTAQMTKASKKQMFEKASAFKKIIQGVSYLTQPNRTRLYLENPNFLEEENKLALEKLQKDLGLKKLPERIEGYDISNIQGKEATGSMVVLTNGEIDKSQYRKFKIHLEGKPNDVGMHKEMMRRRLNHPEWPLPDLIIIDGGRGQVGGADEQCTMNNVQLPIFGLAKRMEWLYPPEGEIVKLPKNSLSLKLLRKLRDEAHRFAISYHRKLRGRILLSGNQYNKGNK
ncbi:GIY-YIG nuclease family protein [Candidatus Daviesbacteria bacterium]|nr:GIY-YIG nuclease family protein [Candidatus Daviesbacteria bacterium]